MLPIELLIVRNMDALIQEVSAPFALFDERGVAFDSVQFASRVKQFRERGQRTFDFAIGDAYGFPAQFKEQAEERLALSSFTLPHRLAQLVAVEQLYRAGTILTGHPYHHGDESKNSIKLPT